MHIKICMRRCLDARGGRDEVLRWYRMWVLTFFGDTNFFGAFFAKRFPPLRYRDIPPAILTC